MDQRHRSESPAALSGVQTAAADPPTETDAVAAALWLIPQARSELDRAEASLIAAARRAGWSWPGIGHTLGLRSGQAAEQRALRLAGALGGHRRDPAAQRHARQDRDTATDPTPPRHRHQETRTSPHHRTRRARPARTGPTTPNPAPTSTPPRVSTTQ